MATVDDKKIIFSMVGVSKTIQQNQKQILKNIYLSFYYGAKIGIIGLNGAGKSTLMKIIAGLETQYQGQVVFWATCLRTRNLTRPRQSRKWYKKAYSMWWTH